jgi:hypothetical protein
MKHHRLSMATSAMTAEGHFILQNGEMRTLVPCLGAAA